MFRDLGDVVSILVTGGAGYIGSHTVRLLRSVGHEVVVLDTLELGSESAVLGASLVVGDVRDRDLVIETCRRHGVTQAVHFAAYKNVGESMSQPGKYWRNNIAGTVELVEAMLAARVSDLVFSSSCSVVGTPDVVPVDEDAPIRPESVYAQTKATMEDILGWYSRTAGLRVVDLRYFNAAGASLDAALGENWDHSQNLIPLVMKAALGIIPRLQVFGNDYPTQDGTCVRDYVHVEDLARAHEMALAHLARHRHEAPSALTLNVGTGVGSSVLNVIAMTEDVTGRSVPFEVVARRVGDPAATYADPRRIAAVLGWTAIHDLRDIISSAWQWHSKTAG